MWRRASGLRRGFTIQFDSTDIIDDMAAATGRSPSSCAAAGCASPSPERGGAVVGMGVDAVYGRDIRNIERMGCIYMG